MNLFGVGPAELIVILVVALVFVGPDRLPRLAAELARTIREIRKYTGSLAAEFNEVIQDFERETAGERSQWKEIGEGLAGATQSVTEALRGARADAEIGGPVQTATSAATPTQDAPSANGDASPAWRDIAEPSAGDATPTTGSEIDSAGVPGANGARAADTDGSAEHAKDVAPAEASP